MNSKDKILEAIYEAIDNFNETQDEPIEKQEDASLYGGDGNLDSIALVEFILLVEESVNESFDSELSLADMRAMSKTQSPFKNVQSLTSYIDSLL